MKKIYTIAAQHVVAVVASIWIPAGISAALCGGETLCSWNIPCFVTGAFLFVFSIVTMLLRLIEEVENGRHQ